MRARSARRQSSSRPVIASFRRGGCSRRRRVVRMGRTSTHRVRSPPKRWLRTVQRPLQRSNPSGLALPSQARRRWTSSARRFTDFSQPTVPSWTRALAAPSPPDSANGGTSRMRSLQRRCSRRATRCEPRSTATGPEQSEIARSRSSTGSRTAAPSAVPATSRSRLRTAG